MPKIPDSHPGYPGSIPGQGIKISLHCRLTEITVISGQIVILSDTISLFAKWTQYLAHKIARRLRLYYLLKGLCSVSAEYEPSNESIPSLFPASPQSPHHKSTTFLNFQQKSLKIKFSHLHAKLEEETECLDPRVPGQESSPAHNGSSLEVLWPSGPSSQACVGCVSSNLEIQESHTQ